MKVRFKNTLKFDRTYYSNELRKIMAKTLYEKLFDAHVVYEAEGETPILYINRHLIHEVTSPQAFDGLRVAGRQVRQVSKTFGTMDHSISTQVRDVNKLEGQAKNSSIGARKKHKSDRYSIIRHDHQRTRYRACHGA